MENQEYWVPANNDKPSKRHALMMSKPKIRRTKIRRALVG
jgi:hypothetical protein